MNLKKLIVFLVLGIFFIPAVFISAETLEIKEGKTLKFNVRGDGDNPWFDEEIVYENINITAATKVILDDQWEYMYVGSRLDVDPKIDPEEKADKTETTVYKYAKENNLATLSINNTGELVLNSGSELSIRNQYSLITTTSNMAVRYREAADGNIYTSGVSSNLEYSKEYDSVDEEGILTIYHNRIEDEKYNDNAPLFTGKIVFNDGNYDTTLTFREASSKSASIKVLDSCYSVLPVATTIEYETPGAGWNGGVLIEKEAIEEETTAEPIKNLVEMFNDFEINSTRAVFNVESSFVPAAKIIDGSTTYLYGKISGNGRIVKKGEGILKLSDYAKDPNIFTDATGLTGSATGGIGWQIEEGTIIGSRQVHFGSSDIYIDSEGTLALTSGEFEEMEPGDRIAMNDETKVKIIEKIQKDELKKRETSFSNDIICSGGGLSITSGSMIQLNGDISCTENGTLSIAYIKNSLLELKGNNDIKNFLISFGVDSTETETYGGESNYLLTTVDGLARENITVINGIEDELERQTAFFELILKEENDKEYTGSLNGDMFLHKLGNGVVTLSGENTFDKGTYITEGGLLLSNSKAIGTGNIWFDGGVASDSTTYSSIGVSSTTTGDVEIANNIHVKTGAILDVAENQNLYLKGDLVCYEDKEYEEYITEFIKNGLGNAIIAKIEGTERNINIKNFNIKEGGFILDDNVILVSTFSLNGTQAFLQMNENAGIKNKIDIYNGDLIIFNEKNLAQATSIHFYNQSVSTEAFSKLHITSNTVLSNTTMAGKINIDHNIEFVIDATTTAKLDRFVFNGGADTIIVKSGDGIFIADDEANDNDFIAKDLYVNGGNFRIDNMNMKVSGETLVDGGILSVSETSHFASTGEDKKITVLSGGIGIYDDNSIDSDTELRFEGTDKENLSRLVVEAADVNLTNSIYVKTGVIIENERDLTFSGEHITGEYGILAKDGAGTMIINSQAGVFNIGELRTLGGNLLVKSNIEISTVSILGDNALLTFENVNNANIKEHLSMGNGGTLSLSTSTVYIKNLDLNSANIVINKSSQLNSNVINFNNSMINLATDTSLIKATTINLINDSYIKGYGTLDSTVNVQDASSIYVGEDGNTGEVLKVKNVIFASGSNLYIDVNSVDGVTTTDKLEVSGNITVNKNSTLYVNLMGDESEYDQSREFEFLTFSGNSYFDNTTNEIFDIILSNPRFSASTALIGKSIFLEIAQEWSVYNIPGVTKNQDSMIKVFNEIYADDKAKENMKSVLSTLDTIYSNYRITNDKTQFINALQDLSGIFYANSFMTSAMLSKANIIYTRLNDYSKEREESNGIWAQAYTNSFSVAENEENPEFKNSIYGMIAGYDTIVDENVIFGLAGFYGSGELKQLEDKANVVDAGINAYGEYRVNENVNVKGLIGYSMQDYDTTRKLRFINQEIKSKYATNTISLDLEAAYRYDLGEKLSLKPLVGANCAIVSNGDIKEDGDSEQRLQISKDSYSKTEIRAGVGLQSRAVSPFNWYISAIVKQIISGDKFTTKSCFMNAQDYDFEIESTKLASTSFAGNIGCSYDINSSFNVSLDLNADTGAISGFGANIGATYKW